MEKRTMTIKKIALKAGVSVATVSRVLNKDEKVSSKTRDRISAVISESGYVPNELGRKLRKTNTGVILVLLPSMENVFYASLVKGIDEECKQHNYNALIADTYNSYKKTLEYCDWLDRKLADGIILISPKITHSYKDLAGKHIVGCSDMHPEFPCPQVDIDNRRAAFEATMHLIKKGCKKIAYLGGYSASGLERYKGYCEALEAAGLKVELKYVEDKCSSFIDTRERVEELLKRVTPDGVFAMSDEFAIAFVNMATSRGLNVPCDVKVVGFDNVKLSLMSQPNLTTIEQPGEEIGRKSVRMLLKSINNEPQEDKFYFDYKLIVRDSTGGVDAK